MWSGTEGLGGSQVTGHVHEALAKWPECTINNNNNIAAGLSTATFVSSKNDFLAAVNTSQTDIIDNRISKTALVRPTPARRIEPPAASDLAPAVMDSRSNDWMAVVD